ncbi:MAG: hypothetical protein J0H32_01545 [Rhizobiales bacterium]|nr:hypothetical protein [Hyphomicrobiales bacterium]
MSALLRMRRERAAPMSRFEFLMSARLPHAFLLQSRHKAFLPVAHLQAGL